MEPKSRLGAKFNQWLDAEYFFFASQVWRELGKVQGAKGLWLGNPCYQDEERVKLCGEYSPDNWVDKDVCDWVQHGPRKRGVLAWRLFNKTELISITYPLWRFRQNKDFKVVCISKSGDKSEQFLKAARTYIDRVWFLRYLAPRERSTGERDRIDAFDIGGCKSDPKDPSFKSIGIDGQIAGSHGHLLVADDIEDKDNCNTITQRDNLRRKADEFNAIPYPDIGEILEVGTFHNEESIHKNLALPEQGGKGTITFRTWPIIYPSIGEEYVGLAPKVLERMESGANQAGDVLAPYRVSTSHVVEQQAVGARWFSLQYKLQANLRETNRYPLRLDDLIVFESGQLTGPMEVVYGVRNSDGSTAIECEMSGWRGDKLYQPIRVSDANEWRPYQQTIMCVDPGGGGKSNTAWAAGSALTGRVFIHELRSGKRGAVNIPMIADCAYRHRVRVLWLEGNLGGAYELDENAFAGLLQTALDKLAKPPGDKNLPEGWGCKVELMHSSVQKDIRIVNALEGPIGTHTVIVNPQVATNQALQHQISHITTTRGSLTAYDEIDVFAMLVGRLSATYRIDPDKALQRSREQAMDDEIAKRRGRRSTGNVIQYRC